MAAVDFSQMVILQYPDPRLRVACSPVESFDEALSDIVARMFELMHDAEGVGLAAPQVGLMRRLFVYNVTGDPADDRVVINPALSDFAQPVESEEGCLSIPDVTVKLRRHDRCLLRGRDLAGRSFEIEGSELAARCWQHECDHLDGRLIIDRMSESDRIFNRRALRQLEARHNKGAPLA
jgi:peptide deformylase